MGIDGVWAVSEGLLREACTSPLEWHHPFALIGELRLD